MTEVGKVNGSWKEIVKRMRKITECGWNNTWVVESTHMYAYAHVHKRLLINL